MNSNITITLFLGATVLCSSACIRKHPVAAVTTHVVVHALTSEDKSLSGANAKFYKALNAMATGDASAMDAIWSHAGDVTDLGPFGGTLVGWNAVRAEFKKEAAMKLGGEVECHDLHLVEGTDWGYAVCTEIAKGMTANGIKVAPKFRATNICRREDGDWKLVHHHTDLSPELQNPTGGTAK